MEKLSLTDTTTTTTTTPTTRRPSISSSSSSSTIHAPQTPKEPDFQSDSEISILDIGPSFAPQLQHQYQADTEEQVSPATKDKPSDAKPDNKVDTPRNGTGKTEAPPRHPGTMLKTRKRKSDTVVATFRTISSSAFFAPLRSYSSREGRPGVNRAKTSFRGRGGALEN